MKRKILTTVIFALIFVFNTRVQGQVKEYFITCNPDDLAYIYENYLEDLYIPITLTYNGNTWNDVQMRIRGDGSRYLPKKSLKVKFDSAPFSNGRYELNFNAEWEDKSYIRAFVSSRVFRQSGQTCFDTDFARLYVNGSFFGLYNSIENVDEQFLAANGYNPDGNLYKADIDGACMSIYDDITNYWEQKTGNGNKEDLTTFINQINAVSDAGYRGFCEQQMDYDQMINIIACNMIVSNQSTYYHNYFLFHDVNGNNKWEMMPWDLDKTLSVYAWKNYTNSSAPWVPDNPFLERALLNPTIFSDIRNRVHEIGNQILTTENFWPVIDSLVTVLQPSVAQDTTDDILDVQEWLDKVNVEKNYIANWPEQIQWQFDHIQSTFVCTRTPGFNQPNVTFHWTPSVDPDGGAIKYRFSLTTNAFEPETTTNYENITDSFLTVNNLAAGNYFWKVTSIKGVYEVEAFDSKNPLTIVATQTLPCLISEDLTLTKANSPYFVNCNVEVEANVLLKIEKGVEIIFSDSVSINIFGELYAEGTQAEPVTFMPASNLSGWGKIIPYDATGPCIMKNVKVINGSIDMYFSDVTLQNFYMLNNRDLYWSDGLFTSFGGNIDVKNSTFIGNNAGEGLIFTYPETANVENCYFNDVPDAIEYLYISGGTILNNIIINPGDDGIDINHSVNSVVSQNKVFDANDNGITFDSCQNMLIENNLIVGCKQGINLKNNAHATSKNNTLYGNKTSVFLYQKYAGSGGGHINIINTIISNSIQQVLSADQYSSYNISYSLCDDLNMPGTGNIFGDPLFVSPADSNFQLQPTSPCINTGDPGSPLNPDGTRSDIGAFYYNFGLYNVIFNEINYKSASSFDTGDWIEIYNIEENPADISGWIFKDNDDEHIFEIPFGAVLQPGGYLVLCEEIELLKQLHPEIENAIGNFSFGLSANGELIRLYNHTGILVDSVVYENQSPWPTEPNGQGPTLELKNPFLDNALGENWASSQANGTPGTINSSYVNSIINEAGADVSMNIYPNPSSGKVNIDFYCHDTGIAEVSVYNFTGKLVAVLSSRIELPGNSTIMMDENLAAGLYIIQFTLKTTTGNYSSSKKLMIE